MANIKITDLTAYAAPRTTDVMPIVDVTTDTTKKVAVGEVVGKITGDVDVATDGTSSIAAGAIVNADVNASAAIAGTKIAPNFGSQTIETTGVISSGRLLVGTSSSSSSNICVVQGATSGAAGQLAIARNNNTPGSSDVLASLNFATSLHENVAQIQAVRDGGTWTASTSYPTALVFSATADGASSPTERVRIDSNGILSTRKALSQTFYSDTGTDLRVFSNTSGDTGAVAIESSSSNTSTRVHITLSNPNGVVGSIRTSGTSTSYNTSSDYRLKENVSQVTNGITRLQQLKPIRFNFIADPDTVVDGFIAHEVQEIVPEAISGEKDAVNENGDPEYQSIDQSKLVPLLTAALQEAVAKIETLEASNADLLARVSVLEAN